MSWKLFWLLVEASRLTIILSAVSISIGFLLSSVVCAAVMSGNRTARMAGKLFVSFFRGTPLLVQLLLIYYLLPQIGLNVPSEVAAIVGMSLCTAAYQAEILRGGFASVPKGLVEAANMCGFSPAATFRRIRLPIAVQLTIPALTSEAIMMLKSSSLVSVVGVIELTRMAQDLAASTYRPLELYAAAGFVYLVINIVVAALGLGLERRMSWGRL
ncbi:amino acid ABC transporter [Hoeflea sp. BAL378]|uniref:amino acid ABC transporter permease n=1 Tax=Hoeflea sp. BAL378 TaxID=1547437 RepID=UPI0005144673|nr:amino acid ABC transporter permease [Hoeflea sp. BAL378]KGF69555.1 amino acid ABC transporter [Hoeflea sp. BAL378]